jgi:hypothetical protein
MKRLMMATSLCGIGLGIAACNYNKEYNNAAYGNEAYNESGANYSAEGGNYAAGAGNYASAATTGWPAGSRIVVENGVTYRIEPGGTRIALGPNDSRIVVENGVRYRVDPTGTRVRIDPSGAEITVSTPGVTANAATNEM